MMSERLGWLTVFLALYAAFCVFWGVDGARSRRGAMDFFLGERGVPAWTFAAAATAGRCAPRRREVGDLPSLQVAGAAVSVLTGELGASVMETLPSLTTPKPMLVMLNGCLSDKAMASAAAWRSGTPVQGSATLSAFQLPASGSE